MSKIQESINLDALGDYLGLISQSGKEALKDKTGLWISDLKRLKQRSHEFAILQEIIMANGLSSTPSSKNPKSWSRRLRL